MLSGAHVCVMPYDKTRHLEGLFAAVGGEKRAELWTYLPHGPYLTADSLHADIEGASLYRGWQVMVICSPETGEGLGVAAYMRLREAHGSVEVGSVVFGAKLRRSAAATEAMYLMAKHVFEDLGYRRYEWKCHAANDASRRAAVRFGFVYEGTFRNDMVVKGANRDTAWYSITNAEWIAVSKAYEAWLHPENFDEAGMQRRRLSAFLEGTGEGGAGKGFAHRKKEAALSA